MKTYRQSIEEGIIQVEREKGLRGTALREDAERYFLRGRQKLETATRQTFKNDILDGLIYLQGKGKHNPSISFDFHQVEGLRQIGDPLEFELSLGPVRQSLWRNAMLRVLGRDANVVAILHGDGISRPDEQTRMCVSFRGNPRAGNGFFEHIARLAAEGPHPDKPSKSASYFKDVRIPYASSIV